MTILNCSRPDMFNIFNYIGNFFGCFPLEIESSHSTLRSGCLKLLTALIMLMTLMYSVCMIDILRAMTDWLPKNNISMSDTIVEFPPIIAVGISDLLIHLPATLYCQKFRELVQLLRKLNSVHTKMFRVEIAIHLGFALNLLYTIVCLLLYPPTGEYEVFSSFCADSRCCNRGLQVFQSCLGYWHFGAVLCATSFVTMFGFRLLRAFKMLCKQIKTTSLLKDTLMSMPWGSCTIIASLGQTERWEEIKALRILRKNFLELQAGFSHFSVFAAPFAIAVVAETLAALLVAVWGIWSQTKHATIGEFVEIISFHAATLFLLLAVTETGHYMTNEVTLSHIPPIFKILNVWDNVLDQA